MKVVLIGFMGSGKSSVGKRLAQLLDLSWVEMDELVYQKTNTKNMIEVFETGGELLLRETEIAIAKEYAPKDNLILSAGGGVVLNKIILDYLKAKGWIAIFLNASFDTIAKRLKNSHSRPLFQEIETAKKLFDLRLPLYRSYADQTVDVDTGSVDSIALKIKEML